jgi:hypothetical protein
MSGILKGGSVKDEGADGEQQRGMLALEESVGITHGTLKLIDAGEAVAEDSDTVGL